MKFTLFLLTAMLLLTNSVCEVKPLKNIKVEVNAGDIPRSNTIVSFNLTSYNIPNGYTVQVKRTSDASVCISQVETTENGKVLFWRIDGDMEKNEVCSFLIGLIPSTNKERDHAMGLSRNKTGNYVFTMDGRNVLCYNTEMSRLPSFVDTAYQRNGYIHPVWSPMGSVLTEINPADHWHHYGIWNPWTSVMYDNKKYDLWNIGAKTGTVRFDSLYSSTSGDLFADILVRHHHVIFQEQEEEVVNTTRGIFTYIPKKEVVIMNENQELRTWNTGNGMFAWDLISDLMPDTELPVLMVAYRYGGLGFRATVDWHKDNCRMLTSEGKTREETDGTNARWVFVTGDNSNGKSGILFLASPGNHNFPEPLRVWDADANNGRGDVMLNFAPAKFEDWLLEPRKQYRLQYRIVTFDGDITSEQAECIWQDYAHPPTVEVIK